MIQQARGNESNWFTIPNYKQLLPFFLFETDFNIFLFAWRINVLTHIKKGRPFPPETIRTSIRNSLSYGDPMNPNLYWTILIHLLVRLYGLSLKFKLEHYFSFAFFFSWIKGLCLQALLKNKKRAPISMQSRSSIHMIEIASNWAKSYISLTSISFAHLLQS